MKQFLFVAFIFLIHYNIKLLILSIPFRILFVNYIQLPCVSTSGSTLLIYYVLMMAGVSLLLLRLNHINLWFQYFYLLPFTSLYLDFHPILPFSIQLPPLIKNHVQEGKPCQEQLGHVHIIYIPHLVRRLALMQFSPHFT